MTTHPSGSEPDLTDVEDALRDLRTRAPETILPATLAAVGLADLYAPLASAIGEVWVAWNGRGVSALMTAPDAVAFEAAFRRAFDRPVRRVGALPPRLAAAIVRHLETVAGRRS